MYAIARRGLDAEGFGYAERSGGVARDGHVPLEAAAVAAPVAHDGAVRGVMRGLHVVETLGEGG